MSRALRQIERSLLSKPRNRQHAAAASFEVLETRTFLSGNVLVSVSQGTLTIRGDAAANVISVDQTGLQPHQVRISGDGATAINKHYRSLVVSGVTDNVIVRMDGGADNVNLHDLVCPGELSINTEGGADTLTLTNVKVGLSVGIRNSPNLRTTTAITNTTVGRNLTILGGKSVALAGVQVKRDTQMVAGRGGDSLTIDDSIFRGNVAIHTGRGADTVQIETLGNPLGATTQFDGKVVISLGSGNDSLQTGVAGDSGHHTVFASKAYIDGGAGIDTFVDSATYTGSRRIHIKNFESSDPITNLVNPRVSATNPANGAINVPLNRKIAVTFSKAMDPLTIIGANVMVTAPGGVPVAGSVAYLGTTMTFTPTNPLSANTTFTGVITTGAKDLAGHALAHNFVWTFRTGVSADTTAPTVNSVNPLDLKTNVAINKIIAATFSEAMDPASLQGNFTLTAPNSTPVTGTVSYDSLSNTASFTPDSDLAPNTLFTATVISGNNGAADLAGNPLASDKVWTFTTGSQIAQAPINLRSAGTFAVMATAAITGTGATQINGDVGLNPGSAQGIPPTQIHGTIHIDDQAIKTAQADLLAAYHDAVSRSVTSQTLPGNMGGLTFTPGLYTNSSSVLISGTGPANHVTLDAQGDANAIFIFKMGSTLTTGPGAQVILAGGAKAGNIFWQVGTSATLNTTTIFKGNILAAVTITVNNGSAVVGRLLGGSSSAGSVTINGSTVTVPA